jgi:hypothetical protein
MNLGYYGWGIVLGWSVWMLVLIFILEILKRARQDDYDSLKTFLLLKFLRFIFAVYYKKRALKFLSL